MFEALCVAPAVPTAANPPAQFPAVPHGAGLLPFPASLDDTSGMTSDNRFPPTTRVDIHRTQGDRERRRSPEDDFEEHPGYRTRHDNPRIQLDRPRLPCLNLLMYDGSVDPITWLTKCDQYFRAYQILEDDKVWLAAFHLSEVAHTWFYQLERDGDRSPGQCLNIIVQCVLVRQFALIHWELSNTCSKPAHWLNISRNSQTSCAIPTVCQGLTRSSYLLLGFQNRFALTWNWQALRLSSKH